MSSYCINISIIAENPHKPLPLVVFAINKIFITGWIYKESINEVNFLSFKTWKIQIFSDHISRKKQHIFHLQYNGIQIHV